MKGKRIIIVGGVPRSGTSLVQKILGLNSRIYAGPEFDHLNAIAKLFKNFNEGVASGRLKNYFDQETIAAEFGDFIERLMLRKADAEGVEFISEKTPDNILAFEKLSELLPGSKFIWVVRDPRAVISSFQKVFRRSDGTAHVGKDIKADLELHRIYFDAGQSFLDKYPEKCQVIRYEQLVSNPKSIVGDLCKFLQIEFEENMLETERKSDVSDMIKEVEGEGAWYRPGEFDRTIEAGEADKWKDELGKKDIQLINDFFRKNQFQVLSGYDFTSPPRKGLFGILSIFPVLV